MRYCGLPNVGKSTLFSALTNIQNVAANYEFATIDPNVGIINVPDKRLWGSDRDREPAKHCSYNHRICWHCRPVKGASKNDGRGNGFPSNIREVGCHRPCGSPLDDINIVRSVGPVDPVSDKEIIEMELQLKTSNRSIKRLPVSNAQPRQAMRKPKLNWRYFRQYKAHLEQGKMPAASMYLEEEKKAVMDLFLLTMKPMMMYVANVDEKFLHEDNHHAGLRKSSGRRRSEDDQNLRSPWSSDCRDYRQGWEEDVPWTNTSWTNQVWRKWSRPATACSTWSHISQPELKRYVPGLLYVDGKHLRLRELSIPTSRRASLKLRLSKWPTSKIPLGGGGPPRGWKTCDWGKGLRGEWRGYHAFPLQRVGFQGFARQNPASCNYSLHGLEFISFIFISFINCS